MSDAQCNAKLESKSKYSKQRNARKVFYSRTQLFLHGDMINNNPWYTECYNVPPRVNQCHDVSSLH